MTEGNLKPLLAKIYGLTLFIFLLIRCNTDSNVLFSTELVLPADAVSVDVENDFLTLGTSEHNLLDSVCADITQREIDGLIHTRIEEKLACDVYAALGTVWDLQIFLNLKLSEQLHMDAVKNVLDKYSIPDPLLTDEIGVFPDKGFQALYEQYVAQGNRSLEEALLIGVMIERLEIEDLGSQLVLVTNPCIINLHTNLLATENKHLAAFNKNLGDLISMK